MAALSQEEADAAMIKFKAAVDAFLMLPPEEQRRRLEEASARAQEINDRFDRSITFTDEEWHRFLRQPMTI